ncbi:hypothetical protein N7513_007713 [Penicillium frequentans]|nr:hypothetical protein N7513_007713 [Penicillium glabrum]
MVVVTTCWTILVGLTTYRDVSDWVEEPEAPGKGNQSSIDCAGRVCVRYRSRCRSRSELRLDRWVKMGEFSGSGFLWPQNIGNVSFGKIHFRHTRISRSLCFFLFLNALLFPSQDPSFVPSDSSTFFFGHSWDSAPVSIHEELSARRISTLRFYGRVR